jgi:hypothetical protein
MAASRERMASRIIMLGLGSRGAHLWGWWGGSREPPAGDLRQRHMARGHRRRFHTYDQGFSRSKWCCGVSRRAIGDSSVSAGSKSNVTSAGIQHHSVSEFLRRKDADCGPERKPHGYCVRS